MQLHGKIALVTGSTSGIGLAIARALATACCDVVLTGLGDAAQLSAMARNLASEHHIRASFIPANLVSPAEIRSLVAAAELQLGAPQVLVNNAGIQHVAPLQQFPDEQWDQILAVNLSAAFHATKACLPAMQRAALLRLLAELGGDPPVKAGVTLENLGHQRRRHTRRNRQEFRRLALSMWDAAHLPGWC